MQLSLYSIRTRKLGSQAAAPGGVQTTRRRSKSSVAAYWPFAVLLLVPLAIFIHSLLRPGYILQYDMVFVPHPHVNWQLYRSGQALYAGVPFAGLLAVVGHLLPMEAVQKLLLMAIFYGAAVAMYWMAPVEHKAVRLLAGIAFAANPFTYDRLMAGHWLFLAGYALLPLFAKVCFLALSKGCYRAGGWVVVLWTAAVLLTPHFLAIDGILFLFLAVALIRSRRSGLVAAAILLGVIVVNAWWWLPLLLGHNFTQTFSTRELYAFATRPIHGYGIWFTLLSFQGFWYGGWSSWGSLLPFWPLVTVLWLLPAWFGLGSLRALRPAERLYLLGLAGAAIFGVLYAAGPTSFIGPLNVWIYAHVPGMSGLREPQKLLSLYCLAAVAFGAVGLDRLSQRKWMARPAWLTAAVLTGCLAWPLLFDAHGQMHNTVYSASWQQTAMDLERAGPAARVVVLPWEVYVDKSFTGRLVANPAPAYFGRQALSSQRAGLNGVADYTDPEVLSLQAAIDRSNGVGFTNAARTAGAVYVLLVHSNDDGRYKWLSATSGLRLIHRDAQVNIYQLTR